MIAWIDASSGASGDMLLGALADAGVPLGVLAEAVEKVAPGQVRAASRSACTGAVSRPPAATSRSRTPQQRRTWRDVERLLGGAGLHEDVRVAGPRRVRPTGRGRGPGARHACRGGALPRGRGPGRDRRRGRGLCRLGRTSGSTGWSSRRCRWAVARWAPSTAACRFRRRRWSSSCAGVPSSGGPVDLELCTPTGAALLTALADDWGRQPAMAVTRVGRRRRAPRPRRATPTCCGCWSGRPGSERSLAPAPRPPGPGSDAGAAAARDQRRRPRPADLAGGDRGAARGRRERRLADPDPDEEGAARAHPERAGGSRPCGRRTPRDPPADLDDRDARAAGRQARARRARWPRSRSTGTRSRSRWPGSAARCSTCNRSSRTSPPPLARSGRPVKTVMAEAVAAAAGSPDGPRGHRDRLRRDLRGRAARQDVHRGAGALDPLQAARGLGRGRPRLLRADPDRRAGRTPRRRSCPTRWSSRWRW